jgi:hypothetical protein
MKTPLAHFNGTNAAFKTWLRSWDPHRDNPALDAAVARHPAGKRLGQGCGCECCSGGFCGGCGHAGCGRRG